MNQTLGFIGIGSMGAPIVRNLLGRGYRVVVYDTDQAAVEALKKSGAESTDSPRAVASIAPTVCLCLPSLEAVSNVTFGPDGIAEESKFRICINLSTLGPSFVEDLAARLSAKSVVLLDCPITRSVTTAGEASLSMTVSGIRTIYNEVSQLLECIADRLFFVGERPGQAQFMKLLNNMLSFTAFVASCEAFVLGVKAGLDPDQMVEVINAGTGRNSATTHKFPNNILPRTFDYGARIAVTQKDIALCLEQSERYGVPMWVGNVVKQMIDFTVSQYGNQVDVTTLVKHYEKWAGIEVVGQSKGKRSDRL